MVLVRLALSNFTTRKVRVALTIADSLTISNRSLIDELEAVAKKHKIAYQLSILPRGGTDAGRETRLHRLAE